MATKQDDKMEDIIQRLREPLPPEAISQHPTKPYLSTIKAIYVVERFNDVFGLGEWRVENSIVEKVPGDKKPMVVVKSVLTVPKFGIYVESFGGNDNEDLGDAYKGACTDALTKIGSYLYVGMDVFKGLATNSNASDKPKIERRATQKQKDYLRTLIIQKGKPMPDKEFWDGLTADRASKGIDKLMNEKPEVPEDGTSLFPEDIINHDES